MSSPDRMISARCREIRNAAKLAAHRVGCLIDITARGPNCCLQALQRPLAHRGAHHLADALPPEHSTHVQTDFASYVL